MTKYMKVDVYCTTCGGTGELSVESYKQDKDGNMRVVKKTTRKCHMCGGKGYVTRKVRI